MSTHENTTRKFRTAVAGLAMLVAMGSLAACGSDPQTTTTTRSVTTDTTAPAPVQAQQTTTVQRTMTNP